MSDSVVDSYLLPRTAEETNRLNGQHHHVVRGSGGLLIHPSVRLDQVHEVLDCCTGTGAWIRAARKTASPETAFDACDISLQQFEGSVVGARDIFNQNIKGSFAETCHNKYDVVHQRFLCGGVAATEWSSVLRNLKELLKPGGKLCLTEFNCIFRSQDDQNDDHPAEWWNKLAVAWFAGRSLDIRLADHIPDHMQKAGFDDVKSLKVRIPYGVTCKMMGQSDDDVSNSIDLIYQNTRWTKEFSIISGVSEQEYEEKAQAMLKYGREVGYWVDIVMTVGTKH